MNRIELGPRSKEVLSWMVISEVLRQSSLDLDIAVLHPGGGQYDTLSLVSFDGHPLVHINRNGANALAGDELVENIFETAAKSPTKAAERILKALKAKPFSGHSANSRTRIEASVRIANCLAFYLSAGAKCEWGWFDSPYGIGPNSAVQAFNLPDSWTRGKGLFNDTSWESAIFLIIKNESPFAAINMTTGEFINSKGEKFADFVKNYENEGLLKSHVGAHMVWRDSAGKIQFQDEVHVANMRMSRRIYSEEYLTVPEETILYEFSCDEEEAILKWNNVERIFSPEDLDSLS